MKTAITLLTCDRPELVEQSIVPLIDGASKGQYHLFVADGSKNSANEEKILALGDPINGIDCNIRGGAGAAIVYALTRMLQHEENYDVVGLCEADVLLPSDWYLACSDLFLRGSDDGLSVGAVSSRCFADRVLFQRDGYAVCHNLGAGHILLTRRAAEIVLRTFRTGWSTDNRRIFAQLSGIDIGASWAFRTNEHPLTADWHWDAALTAHGLASLAVTPSQVEMIGQNPPLAEQGLEIVCNSMWPRDEKSEDAFERYRKSLGDVTAGVFHLGVETQFHLDPNTGIWTYFPHQMHMLGGTYEGDWRLREMRGWGTFAWEAGDCSDHFPMLSVPVFGNGTVLISGGKNGGKVEVLDEHSGFRAPLTLEPEGLNAQILQLQIPGAFNYRTISITALSPGVCFFGIQSRDKQPFLPNISFDHSHLPGA